MNLHNKVAFINGGARIGATVAVELAKRGCHVAVSYRSSKTAAHKTVQSVSVFGGKTLALKADMQKPTDVRRALVEIKKFFGGLNILINMASTYEKTPQATAGEKQWESLVSNNLKSAYLSVQYAALLLKKNGGRVINFADWTAASGRPRYKDFIPYYTAKSGVIGLTQAQALELAPNVLVNAIAPGPILPPAHITNEEVRNVKQVTPLRKWGGPIEIAKAVVFLCETDFVTGECVRVDGGRHLY